ncbi:MAG: hypothetical protein ACYCUF_02090 [Acidimicrobiales bacterium]|nr:hypothetical protein [Actinomycetota bacterium]MDA8183411.1 hypothetical protein [Actinomycetota bacterium]MDA8356249.1 hypothetical protein [Actinomycetota bacterium]
MTEDTITWMVMARDVSHAVRILNTPHPFEQSHRRSWKYVSKGAHGIAAHSGDRGFR